MDAGLLADRVPAGVDCYRTDIGMSLPDERTSSAGDSLPPAPRATPIDTAAIGVGIRTAGTKR